MSKPTNSAARNAMSKFERECYDMGWEDAEERIVKWIKDNRREFEIEDGVFFYRDSFQSEDLIAFIKGENK